MSPPRMARSGDPFDRALLRAGRGDDPPHGAEEHALAALGLSAGLAARSMAARPRPLSTLQWGWPLKAFAIALAVGAGVAGIRMGGLRWPALAPVVVSGPAAGAADPSVAHSLAPASRAVSGRSTTEDPSIAPVSSGIAAPPDASIRPAPRAPSGVSPVRPTAAVSAAPGASAHASIASALALSVEIALVQQAARALASGDAAVALSLLDTYDRQCPHGALADEAGALRVQALARSGRAPEARALARKLLDAHPHGVLATRLKGVLDGSPDKEGR
jgi:hypothetical protein